MECRGVVATVAFVSTSHSLSLSHLQLESAVANTGPFVCLKGSRVLAGKGHTHTRHHSRSTEQQLRLTLICIELSLSLSMRATH